MMENERGLEHRLRRTIYDYILDNPGVTYGKIKGLFSLKDSTLRYHLQTLTKNEHISTKMQNGKKCYYPTDAGSVALRLQGADPDARSATQRQLLKIIRNHPGITKREMVQRTHMSKDTTTYNIKQLFTKKLIWKVRCGKDVGYRCITDERLQKEMLMIMVDKFLKGEMDEKRFLAMKKRLEEIRK